MYKKLKSLHLLLIISILIGSLVSFNSNIVYGKEVNKPSNWAVQDVNWATTYNLVPKELLNNFNQSITRQEMCSLSIKLYEKLAGKAAIPVEDNPFSDTDNVDILKAYNLSIVNGVGNGLFKPNKNATREDIAQILYNTIKATEVEVSLIAESSLNPEQMDSISPWSLNAITYMNAHNIIKGRDDGKLYPKDKASRQESIAIVRRLYEVIMKDSKRASKGLLWKVSDNNNTVYVLGSIHLGNGDIYPLSNTILNAYNKSDYLCVEANVLKSNEDIADYIKQTAIFTDGTTIKDSISQDTYKAFDKAITDLGVPSGELDIVKPWYAALILQNLTMDQNNYHEELGIDYYFLQKARNQKEILEIEGMKFQLDLFNNFSLELQEQFLLSVLNGTSNEELSNESMDIMEYIIKTWKNGNKEDFEEYFAPYRQSSDEVSKDFNDTFWYERDKNMTKTITKYLDDEYNKTYFVIVGAGHLITDNGVINSLINEGFSVEQIK